MTDLRERVEDAILLWDAGRTEGAFLLALIAVAARARQDYPRPIRDRDAFERFVRSRFRPRVSVEYRGELQTLECVFYKWMRCELVHDGGLPVDLCINEDSEPGELSVRAGGAPDYVLLISPGWFERLAAWAVS
jgi:hypothetical protein